MEMEKLRRLNRIFKEDGKTFILPIDHGVSMGPITKLENPKAIKVLLPYVDAIMLTRGILRSSLSDITVPVVLKVSGGYSVIGSMDNIEVVASVKDAIRLDAAAVSTNVSIGTEYEHQSLVSLARLINECEDYGVPVMAITFVGKKYEERSQDSRYLALCARICAEYGASVVKTYYCEKDFERVVNGCPVPVVLAGGPKVDDKFKVLQWVYEGIQKGAAGICLGRNIWQDEHPIAMAKAMRAIVHEGATAKEAYDLYNKEQGSGN